MRVDLEWTKFSEESTAAVTIGISLVVRIVGQQILVPALQPIYGLPSSNTALRKRTYKPQIM